MPPAQNSGTGQLAALRDLFDEVDRRPQLLGPRVALLDRPGLDAGDVAEDRAQVADRLDDVAGAGLALAADQARALADAAQRLAEVRRAADERHGELPLVDVVRFVGRRQHLGLVDVVDAERLQHLRLGEVADPALGHHRDRDGLLDALDHRRVAHARDAAVAADVGGHALERHHRDRAGVLGDLRLLGVDDVHDDAAAQHLRETPLHAGGTGRALACAVLVRHAGQSRTWRSRPGYGVFVSE